MFVFVDELPILRLIEEPDPAIMALKGENITLNCIAGSRPNEPITFVWKKDNVQLMNPNVVVNSRVNPDGKSMETSCNLNLLKVEHSHAGKYQCVVSNSYGTIYSQKSAISVLVYPTFQKIPKNVTVKTGKYFTVTSYHFFSGRVYQLKDGPIYDLFNINIFVTLTN